MLPFVVNKDVYFYYLYLITCRVTVHNNWKTKRHTV